MIETFIPSKLTARALEATQFPSQTTLAALRAWSLTQKGYPLPGEQIMRMVEFDPVSNEEWESFQDPDGPARLLEKWVAVWPINKRSPLINYIGRTTVLCREGRWREAGKWGWGEDQRPTRFNML